MAEDRKALLRSALNIIHGEGAWPPGGPRNSFPFALTGLLR